MADGRLIEVIDLLYDFKYTIPGSKKNPVFLKAGERFRLLEKKSANWYLVSRLKTDESFYIPVVYSEVVKLTSKKPGVVPPKLPTKPKNLLEKLQNDLEINPPSPPEIEDSVKIELFKLLSTSHHKQILLNSLHSKASFHKSDSHVDQLGTDAEVISDPNTRANKEEDHFNSLPKVSPRHHSTDTVSSSLPPHQHTKSPHSTPPNSITPLLPDSSLKSLTLSKPPHSPKAVPPSKPSITDLTPPLPPKPSPTLHKKSYQVYRDESTGQNYYYNPLTDESSWMIPEEDEGEEGNRLELSTSSSDSFHTGSMELLKNSSEVFKSTSEDSKSERLCLSKSGPLNRTKLTEGGRKLKKYWYCTYAVLEGSELSFYKDHKSSAHKSKADLSLDLSQSFVLKGGTSNKQNIIQVITNTGSEYLLQSNDEADVDEWYHMLSEAATIDTAATVVVDITATGEEINRNSSLMTDDSSYTDDTPQATTTNRGTLTSSSERSKLMDRLKMWLGKRPTQESLREKGIYKDAIFGSSLWLICEREDSMVPSFMVHCMQAVEEKGLDVDGIYRISGNMAEIQKLRLTVDSNSTYDLGSTDIHVVAGALKMFLRELQQPLVPCDHYEGLLAAYYSSNKVEGVRSIIHSFPETNYETLKSLLRHLLLVVSHSKENRMQVNNLSIIFGPTLLWPKEPVEPSRLASSLMARGQLLELLLHQYHAVFV